MKAKFGVLNTVALSVAGLLFGASAALAHHSGAMFDSTKTVSITGTVKSFAWTNPHSWLEVMAIDTNGQPDAWSIELNGPATLYRQGFRPNSPKVGDKVTVVAHPLRDGRHAGSVVSVLLPNGQTIGIPST